jgi:hypothetical protein
MDSFEHYQQSVTAGRALASCAGSMQRRQVLHGLIDCIEARLAGATLQYGIARQNTEAEWNHYANGEAASNETKLSDRRRERVWLRLKLFNHLKRDCTAGGSSLQRLVRPHDVIMPAML